MKVSNREKIMLWILGIILVGFGYYNFIYLKQTSQLEEKIQKENEKRQEYEVTMTTINSLEDKKNDAKLLKAEIVDKSSPFYPTISEEHIIAELDGLLKESGLKGGITFKPIVSDGVESSKKDENTLAESSFQDIVNKYKTVISTDDKNKDADNNAANGDQNNSSTSSTNNSNKSPANNSSQNNPKTNDTKEKKNTLYYLKCEVKFEGNYDGIDKLLKKIDERDKKIVVNSIKISQDTLEACKGTIDLEFYAIPKITDELEKYLEWNYNNTYGKDVPFSASSATGITNTDNSDFIASIKPTNSDLPSIILGKANDPMRTSYVYGKSNSEEKVEMVLTEEGGKYYCKYKTSKLTFPAKYDGPGMEFVPVSKNIVINILSETRQGSDDKASVKLQLVNKTDKLVEVNTIGDDAANPRVKIDGDGSNISVNQK